MQQGLLPLHAHYPWLGASKPHKQKDRSQLTLTLSNGVLVQVVEFVRSENYARFTRIIFDTAPTGHTLRLLSVPDFVEASLGKIIRLRKKLASAGDAVRSLFRQSAQQDEAVAKLEALRVQMHKVPCTEQWS